MDDDDEFMYLVIFNKLSEINYKLNSGISQYYLIMAIQHTILNFLNKLIMFLINKRIFSILMKRCVFFDMLYCFKKSYCFTLI